jgi:hypothetical protein
MRWIVLIMAAVKNIVRIHGRRTTHLKRGALKVNPEAPGWTKRFHHKVFASHI